MKTRNKDCNRKRKGTKACGCSECYRCQNNDNCHDYDVAIGHGYYDCETAEEAYKALEHFITVDHVIVSFDVTDNGLIRVTGHFGEGFREVENQKHRFSFYCSADCFKSYGYSDFLDDLVDTGIIKL